MIDLYDDNKVINICIENKPNKKNKYEQISDFAKLFQEHKQQKKKQIILIVISIVAALLVIAGIIYWCIMYK